MFYLLHNLAISGIKYSPVFSSIFPSASGIDPTIRIYILLEFVQTVYLPNKIPLISTEILIDCLHNKYSKFTE